jgi:predicted Rossmann fold flavoprotein
MKTRDNFDVLVIGGGPAGIMAAIASADFGLNVAVLEKNKSLAKKLLLTGGGRCNITNATFDIKKLAEEYGKEGFFLLPAFKCLDVNKTIDFFNKKWLKTKTEGSKVYCHTDKAGDVVNVLEKILKDKKVSVFYNSNLVRVEKDGKQISKVILRDGREISAKSYILATGGKSYGATGSTGQGYSFAESLGHDIKTPKPGLVPVKIKEDWVKSLQGISINSAQFNLLCDNKKRLEINGEVIFTHFGLSGPAILNASSQIEDLSQKGKITILWTFSQIKILKSWKGI